MNLINKSKLVKLSAEQLLAVAPTAVEINGEIVGYFVMAKDVIVVSDLHPVIQRNLRAQEAKARVGMGPATLFEVKQPTLFEADQEVNEEE